MEKAKARSIGREKVARLTPHEKDDKSRTITRRLWNLRELQKARTVMAFASLDDEANLYPLWRDLVEDTRTLVFPVLAGEEGRMDVHRVEALERDLRPGKFGLPEPHDGAPVDPRTIDFMFVPAMAYDFRGHRLGRGGGYYDRFVSGRAPQAFRCGVVFECQVTRSVPVRPHDCLVDALITEKYLRRFNL